MREKQIEEMAKIIDGSLMSVLGVRLNDDILARLAEHHYNAGYRKQEEHYPCDFCAYNPPSNFDGKPCSICPAVKKMEVVKND